MSLVTISASYGAGGSRIGPAVAERLGVPYLGRPPTPGLAVEEAGEAGEGSGAVGGGRLLSRLASMAVAWGTPPGMTTEDLLPDQARRREVEREIDPLRESGRGVILGRGAAALLREDPRALHVLLDGTVEARTRQAMRIEGIDRPEAERWLARVDRYRRAYLEDLYGEDPRAPGTFHLVLDSTAIALDDCVEIIAAAARTRPPPA